MLCNTIREILLYTEQKYGPEDAVRYKVSKDTVEAKTYTDLRSDSEAFSNALEEMGLKGCHIAVTGATSYEWLVTYFGVVDGGSVAVPLDVQLPAENLCDLINRADAEALVMDGSREDLAAVVWERCPGLRALIRMDFSRDEGAGGRGGEVSFSKLIEEHRGPCDFMPQPEDLCTIMYTSGTTGKSKGVMLSHRNLANNATVMDLKIEERTVILSVLPIHHAYCMSMDILKGVSLGAVICINDSLLHVVKNIKLFRPQMILMVPLMIETMAKKLEAVSALPSMMVKNQIFGKQLHTICSGGAYLNPDYVDLFEKYGITIMQGYGMTECSPVISINPPWGIRKDSVGMLMPNCEGITVDGEIRVRGSSVMQGYYKMPEETAQTLEDGWLKTGDLGYIDEDRYVYITGRAKNLIITKNGENVSPEELENRIGAERLVQEILVREAAGVIEAEIFPDFEYAKKKHIKDVNAALRQILDDYNAGAPVYKRIYSLKVRDTEFEKTTSKKIRRF